MQLQINTHSFITLVTGFLLTSTVVLAHPKPLVSNPTCLTNSNHQVELCAVDLVGACAKLFSEGTAPPECPTRSTSIKKRNQYAPVCHVNSHTDSGTTTVVVTSTTVTVIEVTTTTSTTELTSEEETTTSTTTTTTSEEPSTTSTTPTTTEEPTATTTTTTTTTTTEEPTTTTTTTTEVPPLTTATPEPSCIADGQPCADIFRPDLCCGMACTIGGLPTPLCFSF